MFTEIRTSILRGKQMNTSEIVKEVAGKVVLEYYQGTQILERLTPIIESALTQVYQKGVEDSAIISENMRLLNEDADETWLHGFNVAKIAITKAIRKKYAGESGSDGLD